MVGDAGQDIGQPGARVNVVQLGGVDQRVHGRGAVTAAVTAREQPRLSSEGNLRDILPISRLKWLSTIVGTLCMAAACEGTTARGG